MTIALLARAWGNRGELSAIPFGARPERFQSLPEVYLCGGEAALEAEPFEIESVWEHRGRLIVKFRGVDSISAAEALRGVEVRIPREQRPEPPPGEYYHSDLVGCQVVERRTGDRLGEVTGFSDGGGPGLLEVRGVRPGEEILIPFARSICVEIDVAARRIVVDLPEGLKELNAP
ncbi:MAG: ribosome maturation factor RimM [Acidobacteriota bacterium]